MHSDEEEENNSKLLFNVLDYIGVNDEYRMTVQRKCMMFEILHAYVGQTPVHVYIFGSRSEGIFTTDIQNDMDMIFCDEDLPVIEDIAEAGKIPLSLLIVREIETPAGYVKLQLVKNGKPCTSIHWPKVSNIEITKDILITDGFGRIVLFDLPTKYTVMLGSRSKNKPAFKRGQGDMVICFRCTTWPSTACEWLTRQRHFGWPSKETIQELKSLGFFVVKKGHFLSAEIDIEWRISFVLQERQLVSSFTDVQHKCYYALKTLNKTFIKIDYITSYIWKTCLLHVIEENKNDIWKKELLCQSVKLCIEQMLKWVECGFCPNYFIPRDNLFNGKLNDRQKLISQTILKHLSNGRFRLDVYLYKLLSSNQYSQTNDTWYQRVHYGRMLFKQVVAYFNSEMIQQAGHICNVEILSKDYQRSNEYIIAFIKLLWKRLDFMQQDIIITEHKIEESKRALSLLLPFIYTSLASNISAMAIQQHNPQVRSFLLLGSVPYFYKGDLSGRLKFISVLYALGLYRDCEWFLELEDEQFIRNNSSVCICRFTNYDLTDRKVLNTSHSKVCTCITFLPSEQSITPDALQYEMFRHFGISSEENDRSSMYTEWNYRAVVDCNIYFFLLKYLIQRKLKRYQATAYARLSIATLLLGTNVQHRDVACNLLVWTFCSDCLKPYALKYLQLSWLIMSSYSYFAPEILQNQYNAAKLHALVLLYNTWFARKPSIVHFCFQCFNNSQVELQKCSRCKISTYCSKQCQRKNWKIHKTVCKIVRCNQTA